MKNIKMIQILFFSLFFATIVHAENTVGYTAEWLSHRSSLIAKAIPIEVTNIKGPGEVWFTKT